MKTLLVLIALSLIGCVNDPAQELRDNLKDAEKVTELKLGIHPLQPKNVIYFDFPMPKIQRPMEKLPKEIGQFKNLQKLFLGANALDRLPKEFGNLTKLQELELPQNRFTHIPLILSRLTELEVLDFTYNQISSYPSHLA